jgi:hypothetical protein
MSTTPPSFDRAEYSLAPSTTPDNCTRCQRPVGANYYRINGDMACEPCAQQATPAQLADSHTAYTRALLFGIGAAILGMIGYALFEITTGIAIGYLAIGVGYLIGRAMKFASGGRGGRRYQIAGALLTYAAVSIAAVPVGIYHYNKVRSDKVLKIETKQNPVNDAASQHPFPGDEQQPKPAPKPVGICRLFLIFLGIGLASPFFDLANGVGGIIGLVILFVGIRAAWGLTSGVDPAAPDISGPFANTPGTVPAA